MINSALFTGLGVALATPFSPHNPETVDLVSFRALIRSVRSGGADFLVVLGSTGEAATVREEEREGIIRTALEESGGLPVVVGVGHNATERTVELARAAAALGIQGLLVVTPYYNKPQPAGLEAHFRAVAAAVPDTPIIAYNVPGRTGLNMIPDTLARLWTIPQLIGVKESSGNLAQIGEIARCLPPGKLLLAGDDALALPSIATGASGLVSVAGNAAPALVKALVSAAMAGRMQEAQQIHYRLLPLMDALFAESNPVPLKAGLEELGLCSSIPRLPLVGASESTRQRVRMALRQLGLLEPER
jgi:4-hydroxy-tetrahydrodipicolinate synthase